MEEKEAKTPEGQETDNSKVKVEGDGCGALFLIWIVLSFSGGIVAFFQQSVRQFILEVFGVSLSESAFWGGTILVLAIVAIIVTLAKVMQRPSPVITNNHQGWPTPPDQK